MKRVHLRIHGRVQGVFYRANTKKEAVKLGLKGYVQNMSDGTVEITAEGPEYRLNELIDWCWKGSSAADVDDIEINWSSAKKEFDNFRIKY